MGSEKQWIRNVSVCAVHGDSAWYVCYEDNVLRLRLTHRGTWSMDDMDIYWKSQAEAFAALHVAPCPLEDPYARIAELQEAVRVLATDIMEDAKRIAKLAHESDVSWEDVVNDAVWANPIAAAAVREAGR